MIGCSGTHTALFSRATDGSLWNCPHGYRMIIEGVLNHASLSCKNRKKNLSLSFKKDKKNCTISHDHHHHNYVFNRHHNHSRRPGCNCDQLHRDHRRLSGSDGFFPAKWFTIRVGGSLEFHQPATIHQQPDDPPADSINQLQEPDPTGAGYPLTTAQGRVGPRAREEPGVRGSAPCALRVAAQVRGEWQQVAATQLVKNGGIISNHKQHYCRECDEKCWIVSDMAHPLGSGARDKFGSKELR